MSVAWEEVEVKQIEQLLLLLLMLLMMLKLLIALKLNLPRVPSQQHTARASYPQQPSPLPLQGKIISRRPLFTRNKNATKTHQLLLQHPKHHAATKCDREPD